MPFHDHDLQRLAHLSRLERALVRQGEPVMWDLGFARLVVGGPSEQASVRTALLGGQWLYTWDGWPWCRVDAVDEGVAQLLLRKVSS
ncbi:hypothetical protein ABGB18_26815 [Nonomuraea sp. B12E4]|uniref:hypothetical protein n=1 Tax=Nonomuraea sp. B12E4 TaxID=3153564 RepID=UPI00325F1B55